MMRIAPDAVEGDGLVLEPLAQENRREVQQALDCDPAAWDLQVSNGAGDGFDLFWAMLMRDIRQGKRIGYAVRRLTDGRVVGTTSFSDIVPVHRTVEIGTTFLHADARGSWINPAMKLAMLRVAFGSGAVRVQLQTDSRNSRSQAAIARIGGRKEGVLRRHKTTWTGHQRDSVIFSIVDCDWPDTERKLVELLNRRRHRAADAKVRS